jgi:hypothetical protein
MAPTRRILTNSCPSLIIGALLLSLLLVGCSAEAQTPGGDPPAPADATTPGAASGSGSISTNAEGNRVTLDFDRCEPGRRRIDLALGSVTLHMLGRSGDFCQLDYGGEVENPLASGKLTTTCRVPANLGRRQFTAGDTGLDLSALDQYCRPV